jgi:hypothetical protein
MSEKWAIMIRGFVWTRSWLHLLVHNSESHGRIEALSARVSMILKECASRDTIAPVCVAGMTKPPPP